MKRFLISLSALLVCLTCFHLENKAQTYNVGAGGAYTTLNEAVAAYNTMVLTQPVVFLLTDPSYTLTSELAINSNATSSNINTLTIKPAPGVTAVISGALPGAAVFKITGDNIIINGSNNGTASRNLTIANTNLLGRCINIGGPDQANSADNITCKNCIISAGGGGNYNVSLLSSNYVSAGFFNNISIENNIVQRSVIGIYILAATGAFQNGTAVNISGNDLSSTGADAITLTGISLAGLSSGCIIENNAIGNIAATSTSPAKGITVSTACSTVIIKKNNIFNMSYSGANAASPIGIEINSTGGNDIVVDGNTVSGITSSGTTAVNGIMVSNSAINVVVKNNIVSNITSSRNGVAAFGIQFNPTSTSNMSKLYNNFIYGIASAANGVTAGIYVPGSGLRQIAYNSVLLTNAPGESHAFICSTSTVGRINCYNNNFINRSPSTTNSYGITQTSGITNTTIDFNNVEGTPLGRSSGANLTTLAEVKAIFGANTLNISPVFLSATDLHLASTGNEALDNKGTPVAGITTDIDDSLRNVTTPDIGADEFSSATGGTGNSTWTGNADTDWGNAANWQNNQVPGTTSNVIIPAGRVRYPLVSVSTSVKSLTAEPGAAVILGTGVNLVIVGN